MNRALALCLGLVLLLTGLVLAAIPQNVTYQGRLTQNGAPVADGNYQVTVAIYNTAAGGVALWSSGAQTVATKNGLFTIRLGETPGLPFNIFVDSSSWVGITVGTGPELTPRTPFSSVPYAVHALTADNASNVADNSITSAKIVNGTISLADIGQNGATTGKIIKWNGSAWALANDSTGTGSNTSGWVDNGAVVSLANPNDTVGLTGTSTIRFGSGANRITGLTNDLRVVTEDLSVLTTEDVTFGKYGVESWIKFDNLNKRVGIGTLTVDDLLHLENDTIEGTAFLKLQTSHATNFGEAGLRFTTPQNTWHLRMDGHTNNNAPNGALSLRSQDLGTEVLTVLEDGKVGIGTTVPTQKLHVYGNARVKDTLMATTLTGNFAGTYKDASIHAADIQDEPGIASRYSGGKGLGTSSTVIDSAAIAVPAAGYVFAIASGYLVSPHTIGDFTNTSVGINDSATHPANHQWWHLPANLISGDYSAPFSCQGIFRVAAAGTYTYYSVGRNLVSNPSDADAVEVWYHTLTLLYFPTAYGVVEESPVAALDGDPVLKARESSPPEATNPASSNTLVAKSSDTEGQIQTLIREVATLRQTVDSLKRRRD